MGSGPMDRGLGGLVRWGVALVGSGPRDRGPGCQ